MTELVTVELTQLHFFAYHGLYAEERKTGNEFEINIAVSYAPVSGVITDIQETVNYVKLYELVKTEMQKPRDLLETLAIEITDFIHASFKGIKKIEVGVRKLYPPMPAFTGSAGIKYTKEY